MEITRDQIISTLSKRLGADPNVLAVWLEGADATGTVDEYSDIDLCCSVATGTISETIDAVLDALEGIGTIDLVENLETEEDCRHVVLHLAGTSDFLLLDFNVFAGRGSTFAEADEIEKPLILFDKASVIRFLKREEYWKPHRDNERIQQLKNTVAQYSRIDKYVKRGHFLEAYGYYHRWLLEPLVEVLRMRYTPLHPDYYIVHISRHLPEDVLMRLEELFKVNSVAEIQLKSRKALAFFNEIVAGLTGNR